MIIECSWILQLKFPRATPSYSDSSKIAWTIACPISHILHSLKFYLDNQIVADSMMNLINYVIDNIPNLLLFISNLSFENNCPLILTGTSVSVSRFILAWYTVRWLSLSLTVPMHLKITVWACETRLVVDDSGDQGSESLSEEQSNGDGRL